MRIAVVGSGIAGPTLALTLKDDADVVVYEKRTGRTDASVLGRRGQGSVLGVDHRSLDILGQLGIGTDEIVPFGSDRVVSVRVANRTENRVETIYPGANTTWHLLNSALTSRLPAGTVRQARVTGAGPDGLELEDGGRATADLYVFADGRHSVGRDVLDGRRLRYAGYGVHRGQSPEPPRASDFLSYRAPHFQLNLFPTVVADQVMTDWVCYVPHTADEWRGLFGVDETRAPFEVRAPARDLVDEVVRRTFPSVAEVVASTAARGVAPVVDVEPPDRAWSRLGDMPAVMLGDALAPVRPHTARGANNGIQEAASLASAVRGHVRRGADLARALDGWEDRLLPLVRADVAEGPQLATALGLP